MYLWPVGKADRAVPAVPRSSRPPVPMAVPVTCDECFTPFEAPDAARGKRVRCPSCSSAVRVGGRSGGGAVPSPRRSRGKAASSSSSGPSTGLLIGGGLAALALVGGGMLALGMMLSGGGGAVVADTGSANSANSANGAATGAAVPAADRTPAPRRGRDAAGDDADDPETDENAARWADFANGGGFVDSGDAEGEDAAEPGVETDADRWASFAGTGDVEKDGAEKDGADKDGEVVASSGGADAADPEEGGLPAPRDKTLASVDLVAEVMPSVVRINNTMARGGALGSGYVVHPDGIVITNYHVISEANKVDVQFEDGTRADSPGYLLVEPQYDIAIIKIDVPEGRTLTPVPLLTDTPRQGTAAMAFGAPRGNNFSTTTGSVSAIRDEEEMRNTLGEDIKGTWIQTDASVSSGNSGGPLVDYEGNVIAMNTRASTNSGASGVTQNLNYSVSSKSILEKLKVALAEYDGPDDIKPWKAEDLKEYDGRLDRKLVENELDTNKGLRILSAMTEVLILQFQDSDDLVGGAVHRYVNAQAEKGVEKVNLKVMWQRPDRWDFAVLVVKVDMEPVGRDANALEVVLKAEVVVPDTEDDSKQNLFCRVWTHEESIGTIAPRAIVQGRVPRGFNIKMKRFFDDFRRTFQRAQEDYLAGKLDRDTELDGGRLAKEGDEGLFEELFGGLFKEGNEDGSGGGQSPEALPEE